MNLRMVGAVDPIKPDVRSRFEEALPWAPPSVIHLQYVGLPRFGPIRPRRPHSPLNARCTIHSINGNGQTLEPSTLEALGAIVCQLPRLQIFWYACKNTRIRVHEPTHDRARVNVPGGPVGPGRRSLTDCSCSAKTILSFFERLLEPASPVMLPWVELVYGRRTDSGKAGHAQLMVWLVLLAVEPTAAESASLT